MTAGKLGTELFFLFLFLTLQNSQLKIFVSV